MSTLNEPIGITRAKFVDSLTDKKEDRFAKTFIAKCDMIDAWDECMAIVDDDGEVMGAIVTTISKRSPPVANLQLLHTFHAYRGRGVGSLLVWDSLHRSVIMGAQYYRVSADPDAIPFYEKYGFKYIGKQKSGSQLSMFKLTTSWIKGNDFTPDEYIWKQATRKGKGGCVELFMEKPGNDLDSFLGS